MILQSLFPIGWEATGGLVAHCLPAKASRSATVVALSAHPLTAKPATSDLSMQLAPSRIVLHLSSWLIVHVRVSLLWGCEAGWDGWSLPGGCSIHSAKLEDRCPVGPVCQKCGWAREGVAAQSRLPDPPPGVVPWSAVLYTGLEGDRLGFGFGFGKVVYLKRYTVPEPRRSSPKRHGGKTAT